MELVVPSLERLEQFVAALPAAAVLFSSADCAVCRAIAPRIRELIELQFPRLALLTVDIAQAPDAAGRFQVMAIPTLALFFDRREFHRFVRVFGIDEIRDAIARPYRLLFNE